MSELRAAIRGRAYRCYPRPRSCRNVTFLACSLGVLVFPYNQACNLATESSCAIAGGSTKTLIRVAGLMLPNVKPLRPNSAIPSTAAS